MVKPTKLTCPLMKEVTKIRYGMNGMTDLITMTHMEEHLTLHLSAGGTKLTCCLHNRLNYFGTLKTN